MNYTNLPEFRFWYDIATALMKYLSFLASLLAFPLSSCLSLFTTHLSQINHAAPFSKGQVQVRAGVMSMNNASGSMAQAWWAPINHLVVMADGGMTRERREGTVDPFFGREYYGDNIGRGRTVGGAAGYWRTFGIQGFSVVGGMSRDVQTLHYREGPAKDSAYTEDVTLRHQYVRPYIQGTYYLKTRTTPENGFCGGIQVGGRMNRSISTQFRVNDNLSPTGSTNDYYNMDFARTRAQFWVLQLNVQGMMAYKAFTFEAGPQINLYGKGSPSGYKAPRASLQLSVGILLGWKKGLGSPPSSQ